MQKNPLEKFKSQDFSDENYNLFDLHRPHIDSIILVSKRLSNETRTRLD